MELVPGTRLINPLSPTLSTSLKRRQLELKLRETLVVSWVLGPGTNGTRAEVPPSLELWIELKATTHELKLRTILAVLLELDPGTSGS